MSMQRVDPPEEFHDLLAKVSLLVRENGCPSTRFAIVTWCDCSEGPEIVGSSAVDTTLVLMMLRAAADQILEIEDAAGHA